MEQWKDIVEIKTKHIYQISNTGVVRMSTAKGYKIVMPAITKKGYLFIQRGGMNLYIHRLVCIYFIPNPLNKPQVNHINGIKTDNRIENLQWSTAKENIRHSYKIGTSKTGEQRHLTKYTDDQVRQIRKRYDYGMRICDISRILNISPSAIYPIAKRLTYKYTI